MSLYQWGPRDPMLEAWMNAFPGVIKPSQDIPSYLLPHMRYPPDLFEVQREVLSEYHVLNPQAFYGGQNFWTVPNDPTGATANRFSQPSVLPDRDDPPGTGSRSSRRPRRSCRATRANLAADMVVDSNLIAARLRHDPHPRQLPQDAVTEGTLAGAGRL